MLHSQGEQALVERFAAMSKAGRASWMNTLSPSTRTVAMSFFQDPSVRDAAA